MFFIFSSRKLQRRAEFFKNSLRIPTGIPSEKQLNSDSHMINFSNEVSTTVSFISEIEGPPSRFSSLSSSLDIPSENETSLIENQENNVVIAPILDIKECQDLNIFVPENRRITFSKLPDYTDSKELETVLTNSASENDCDSLDNENVNPNELENYYDSKIGVLQHGRCNHIR